MDVRGGRRTADPRQAVAGSDEAGAAPQAAGREAAADPSRVNAAEPQPAEAAGAREDATPRNRRGRSSAEHTSARAEVYAMGNSGDEEEEVAPVDESRRLPRVEGEGDEGEVLRDQGEVESQADWTLASLLLRPATTVRLVKKFQKGLLTAPKRMRQPSVLIGRQLPIPKYKMSVSPMRVQMRLRLPYIIS